MPRRPRRLGRKLSDRWLLFRALLWVTGIRVGLSLFPFRTLHRWQERLSRPRGTPPEDPPHVSERRVAHAAARARRAIPGARCLAEAMAGQVLLARWGLASELRIGVRREEGAGLAAHAWLEARGQVILGEAEPGRFTELHGGPGPSGTPSEGPSGGPCEAP